MLRRERGISWLAVIELDCMLAGLAAGILSLLVAVLFAVAGGQSAVLPFRMVASVLFHDTAMNVLSPGVALLVGLSVNAAISMLFGFFFGLIATDEDKATRGSWARQAGIGVVVGLFAYFLDVQFIGRIWYPWFLGPSQLAIGFLHAVPYGLTLGLVSAWEEHHYRMPYPRVSSLPRREI